MSQHNAKRIEQLVGAMTVEEKIGQLNMLTADLAVTGPACPRITWRRSRPASSAAC
jgi:hypothetical protein